MQDALVDTEREYASWRSSAKPSARLDAMLSALKATELTDFEVMVGENGRARFRYLVSDQSWADGSWMFAPIMDAATENVEFRFAAETGMVPPKSMMLQWRAGLLWSSVPGLLYFPLRHVGGTNNALAPESDGK